jgi:hypothetical protein
VVRYNGGGVRYFRRGSAGAVVGSDEGGGGALTISGLEGGAGRWRVCMHMRRRWWLRPFRPRRKMTGQGPTCWRERVGRASWLGRPKAKAQWRLAAVAQWEGKGEWAGRGGRRGELRLGRIRSRGRIQKEILFEFQLILEFGRTLENCRRRLRSNFDMGIFLKIF